MYNDKSKPEYYAERIFYTLLLIHNYCKYHNDICEIETIKYEIEHTCKLADKLYSYFINNETFE